MKNAKRKVKSAKTGAVKGFVAVLAAATVLQAGAETVTYEGRLLDQSGAILANESRQAAVYAYADKNDETTVLSGRDVTIATDANGCFSVSASLDVPSDMSVFWVGVTVAGAGPSDPAIDVRPLMQVNPAPFALVAAEAARIESDGTVKLAGYIDVGEFAGSPDVTVANEARIKGDIVLGGDVEKNGDVYVKSLDATRGNLGMMRISDRGNITTQWEAFTADWSAYESISGLGSTESMGEEISDYSEAESDGFAMVMVKASVGDSSGASVDIRIHNGDITICDYSSSDENKFLVGSDDAPKTVVRLFTFPVRKGRVVVVTPILRKNFFSRVEVRVDVKMRQVYFGAK